MMNKVEFILCQTTCGLKNTDQETIEDCILSQDIKETFKQFLSQKEIPNLCYYQVQPVQVKLPLLVPYVKN